MKRKKQVVGFYKDEQGKTRPVTKPSGKPPKKIVRSSRKFVGIKPQKKMPAQLSIGVGRLQRILPVQNRKTGWRNKPRGGFWTSTFLPRGRFTSDWVCFLGEEALEEKRKHLLLQVKSSAKVFHIDSESDLTELIKKYPDTAMMERQKSFMQYGSVDAPIDWESVSKVYDGVHLTEKGQHETRDSSPYDLSGWDAESTVWFRNVFSSMKIYQGKLIRN